MVVRATALLAVLAMLVAGCGPGDQPSSVEWRNVTIQLPDGWYLTEQRETRLSIASHDIGPAAFEDAADEPIDQLEGDVVAMFFTHEPRTVPDDWREFVEQQGATLEADEQVILRDDVPATQLVFSYTTNGTATRELVAVIPSREIVVLAQPVPAPGDEDAPEVFLEHLETFLEVLETAEFGAPVLD